MWDKIKKILKFMELNDQLMEHNRQQESRALLPRIIGNFKSMVGTSLPERIIICYNKNYGLI